MHNLKLLGQSMYLAEPYISQSLITTLVVPWIRVKLAFVFALATMLTS